MTAGDIAVVVAYLLLVFAVGSLFTKRAHTDTTSYFLSSRGLPWWIAGTSMVATSFSCDTPLYVTQLVRSGGISLNWQWWSFGIGGLFSAFLLARLWRRAEVVTDLELAEVRYGPREGAILRSVRAAWMALAINTIGMSWVLLAMAKIIAAVWGGPKWAGVIAAAALAVAYSFLAGFWGVVVTDVAQFVIALAGAIVLAIVAVNAAGGMEAIVAAVPADKIQLLPDIPAAALFSGEFWTSAFGGFIVYASFQWWANINADGGGKVIQRMSAARSEGHAFGATLWFNVAHYALRTWPWVIAALASLVLYPALADDEMAYPRMIVELLPSPWTGFLVAGLFAAFMSTIDTQLNWGASYLTHDIYRRWLAPDRSEKHYVRAAKLSMLVLIAVTAVIAQAIESVTEAFKFIIAFGAGTGPVLILRWFWWRVNAWAEIAAMIASTVISSAIYLSGVEMVFPLRVVTIAAGSALVWVPVMFATRPAPGDVLRGFLLKTRPPGAWKPVRRTFTREQPSGAPELRPQSIRNDLLGWLGGMLLTFGLMFAIGYALFAQWPLTALALALAVAGAVVVRRWWRTG
ncbi:MAG: Sodium/glucose cotransporter [Calditrichaeota bacterium]|nr:Sodium/glucose cotransporter [Calditrichota bacterium]